MTINSNELIQQLIAHTEALIAAAEKYQQQPYDVLNWKADSTSWSILECIEHLNRYGQYYLPKMELIMHQSSAKANVRFKSGWLGNYFANSMLPKDKLNKMKTFKIMNPSGSALDRAVLIVFLQQQNQLLILLNQARDKNLSKIRVPISISKWIKLKLGDTFRFIIYHNQRHIAQANRALKNSMRQQ